MGQNLFGGFTDGLQAGSQVGSEADSQAGNQRQLQAGNQPGVTTGQPTDSAADANALFKELNGDSIFKAVKVCLKGSSYTGPSLANTIGLTEDKFQTVVDSMATWTALPTR